MARILVIEDDEMLGRTVVQALSAAGHAVSFAENGFDGAAKYRQEAADLILIDLNMPYSGLQTIRVLRAEFPPLVIIAMSGNPLQLDVAGAIGANRILHKPFLIKELTAAIDALLGPAGEKPPAKT